MNADEVVRRLQEIKPCKGEDCVICAAVRLIESLQAQIDGYEKYYADVVEIRERYATAARAIKVQLRDFCDEGIPYPEMVADAARKAAAQLAEYTAIGLTPGDVKDLQQLCKENGLSEYVDLIVEAKRQMSKANEQSMEQDERIEQLESELAELLESHDILDEANIALHGALAEAQSKGRDARNELCQKCGRYKEAHNGACDGCRWREIQ